MAGAATAVAPAAMLPAPAAVMNLRRDSWAIQIFPPLPDQDSVGNQILNDPTSAHGRGEATVPDSGAQPLSNFDAMPIDWSATLDALVVAIRDAHGLGENADRSAGARGHERLRADVTRRAR